MYPNNYQTKLDVNVELRKRGINPDELDAKEWFGKLWILLQPFAKQ